MPLFLVMASIAYVLSYSFRPDRIFDSDTLWHIKAGEWILSHHTVPMTDPFSWSAPGVPWVAHEWLFELALAAVAKINPIGISIFSTVLIMTWLFMYWKLIKITTSSEITTAFFYLLALLMLSPGWTARPHLVGYALFVITLYLLKIGRKEPLKLWLLPAAFLLWANCHASVILGLGIIGLETAISFVPEFETDNLKHTPGNRKNLIYIFISCLLASVVNPHGVNLWFYAFKASSDPAYKSIQEWYPPVSIIYTALIFLTLVLAVVFMAIKNNKVDFLVFVMALLTLFGTMTSVRHFSYFVMVWMLMLAQLVGQLVISRKTITAIGGILAVIFFVKLFDSGWLGNDTRALAEKVGWPVKAVDWLEDHHAEKVFNHYNWGGYLIYRGIPVFVDGRADMYHMAGLEKDAFIDQNNFCDFKQPPEDILEKYDAHYILFPSDAPQMHYLKKFGWKEVFSDEKSTVLERGVLQ